MTSKKQILDALNAMDVETREFFMGLIIDKVLTTDPKTTSIPPQPLRDVLDFSKKATARKTKEHKYITEDERMNNHAMVEFIAEHKGITRSELCEMCGYSYSTFARIHGGTVPVPKTDRYLKAITKLVSIYDECVREGSKTGPDGITLDKNALFNSVDKWTGLGDTGVRIKVWLEKNRLNSVIDFGSLAYEGKITKFKDIVLERNRNIPEENRIYDSDIIETMWKIAIDCAKQVRRHNIEVSPAVEAVTS